MVMFNTPYETDTVQRILDVACGAIIGAGAMVVIGVVAASMPLAPAKVYDLVQIDITGEADVIDYNLTASDCGLAKQAQERAGYNVKCEKQNW